MEVVAGHNTAAALVVSPGRVLERVDGVADLIAKHHLGQAVTVGTASDFVPWVVSNTIVVDILAHHHDAGLCRTCKAVAGNIEVTLSVHVGNAVVEMKRHVAAIGT